MYSSLGKLTAFGLVYESVSDETTVVLFRVKLNVATPQLSFVCYVL